LRLREGLCGCCPGGGDTAERRSEKCASIHVDRILRVRRPRMSNSRWMIAVAVAVAVIVFASPAAAQGRLQSSDLFKLRQVAGVQLSPDGARAAYVVENNDRAGRAYGQLWVMTIADGKTVRFGGDNDASGDPEWSPDGQWLAY